jgi:aryl-alcohol dehydrogenase-like predicted oxidoreductase
MSEKALSIGTYQIHGSLYPILSEAWKRKKFFLDTAPNYRGGDAHQELYRALIKAKEEEVIKDLSDVRISTKVGFIPSAEKESLLSSGVIQEKDTYHSHNISECYIRYQLERTFKIFKIGILETIFLHNPEAQFNIKPKEEILSIIKNAFKYFESLVENKKIEGYGISTWTGFEGDDSSKNFSIKEFVSIAESIAGKEHHFKIVQLPVSMIKIDALRLDLKKEPEGPLHEAAKLNINVHVSSPLHGGQLPKILTKEIIELVGKNLTPAQAALLFARSHPAVTRVLTSPSTIQQLDESLSIEMLDDLSKEKFLSLVNMLL